MSCADGALSSTGERSMNLRSVVSGSLPGLARLAVVTRYARQYRRFQRVLMNAREVQHRNLLGWVRKCRQTRFGQDHGFESIRTVDDFRRQVPISDYDYFAPYINDVAAGDLNALFPPSERVERFTITTGSTGVPKLNPVTPTWMRYYRAAWDLWGGKMLLDHLPKVGGKILHVIGSYDMGRTEAGIPISMVSALLARHQQPLVRPFYVIPDEVADIRDSTARCYAMLRLSIGQPISLIVAMNPGILLRMAELGDNQRETLIRDVRDGTISGNYDIPTKMRRLLLERISGPNRNRAMQLEQVVIRTGRLYPRDYWNQPIIACWLGGTVGYQARYVADYYGDSPKRDQGLVSSEGRHTLPFQDELPHGVLAVKSGYYEFIPVSESTSVSQAALEGHELEVDRDYRIVMTTYSGYYRYDIGDIVRCRGFVGEAPLLEFMQKAGRCGDLEGEKLTEHQFLEAAWEAAEEQGIQLGCITAVPSRVERTLPRYRILVEYADIPEATTARQLLANIDRRLQTKNFLYAARRRDKVLGAPEILRIQPGAWRDYIQTEVDGRGTGEAQYKHPALVKDATLLERFQPIDRVELIAD